MIVTMLNNTAPMNISASAIIRNLSFAGEFVAKRLAAGRMPAGSSPLEYLDQFVLFGTSYILTVV